MPDHKIFRKGRKIFRKLRRGCIKQLKASKQFQAGKEGTVPVAYPMPYPMQITATLKPEAEEEEKLEGIEIPVFKVGRLSMVGLREKEETTFTTQYSLTPKKPKRGEPVLAYAKIVWDPKSESFVYNVVEPRMTENVKRLFLKVKNLIEEKLDVDLSKLKTSEAKDYLHKQIFQLLDYFKISLTESEKLALTYYIDRDFLGLGIIEPLINDTEIEDISCDGINIPVFVFHRNPLLGSIPTNIVFNNPDELDSYLVRLAQLCGQGISVIDPLLDGSLPDGSRIQGTLATDIARRGSNFTIRKFTEKPFTPTDLINFNTVDIKTLAYLWFAVDSGCSVLVSGGTATGKTVFLNVLSLFIKPEMKVVSIEDTAELKLPHPHWVPHVARVSISTQTGKLRGEIDLFDLLKESLRQRPDYIIVGEVRGTEAYVLFQQMATGHPSLATIHSESIEKLANRLVTPPISLPPSLLESLDLVAFLSRMRYRGKNIRKVTSVYEVTGFDFKRNTMKYNQVFGWDPATDQILIKNKSHALWKIMKRTGMKENDIVEELKRRMSILFWLQEQNINDYRDVGRVMSLYYDFPEMVLDALSGGI